MRVRISPCAQLEPQRGPRRKRAFQSGYQKSSLRAVVRRLNPTAANNFCEKSLNPDLELEVHWNWNSLHALMKYLEEFRTSQPHRFTTQENQKIAGASETARRKPGFTLDVSPPFQRRA